ncbi:hypothetical protein JCM3766R1_005431 [Sporobolomyces carnicolor]
MLNTRATAAKGILSSGTAATARRRTLSTSRSSSSFSPLVRGFGPSRPTSKSTTRLATATTTTIVFVALAVGIAIERDDGLQMKSSSSDDEGIIDMNDGQSRFVPLTFLWGRNSDLVVSPPDENNSSGGGEFVKKPRVVKALSQLTTGVFRDLKLSRTYAVAVDDRGDCFQWGLGDDDNDDPRGARVEPTLKGKRLTTVEPTEQGKVFGLDQTGRVWVWSSSKRLQRQGRGDTSSSSSWWWLGQGTVWGTSSASDSIDCIELKPDSSLNKGEKFISLSSGQSHLLALTSHGRSFAVPLNLSANEFGQLGVRNVQLLTPRHPRSSPVSPLSVRLEPDERVNDLARDKYPQPPKNLDPLLLNSTTTGPPGLVNPAGAGGGGARNRSDSIPPLPAAYQTTTETIVLHQDRQEHSRLERSIEFSTTLHEIPSLRSVFVSKLVAGRNHSLALLGGTGVAQGRVLGFGAGAYGQLGLGPSLSYPSIPTPTEVPFVRSPAYSGSKPTSAKCLDLAAGGNLSYFVVETEKPGRSLGSPVKKEIDLLACGQGQFGGLGNGLWAHATHPLRVKTVSGLTEWNEVKGRVEPIGIKDVQAGETHVAIVLDNAVTFPDGSKFGRDVFTFGQNEFYQLGNGKRASLATPQHLPPLPYPSLLKQQKISQRGAAGSSDASTAAPVEKKAEETLSSGTTSPMPHKRLQLAVDLPVPKGLSKKTRIEEAVVTGDSTSGVYWKIVS